MVGFDVPFAFVAGSLFGWRGGGKARDLALLYAGAGIAAPGVWYLEVYPGWDWQYLLDPATLPAGYEAAFAAAVVFAGLAGHEAGRRGKNVFFGGLAFLGLYLLVSVPRMIYVSDYATFMAGNAPMLPGRFLLDSTLVMGLSAVLGAACLYRCEQQRNTAGEVRPVEAVPSAEAA